MKYTDIISNNTDEKLRTYQLEHKVMIYKAWDEGCRSVMLQMPTGTGKTYLFVSIIKDLQLFLHSQNRHCRVLVLAHRNEILDQICDTLYYKYNINCVKIDATNRSTGHSDILVASVPTMANRLNEYKDNFDLIVVDEAHHTKAESYKKIIRKFPRSKVLGVTATPYRLSGKGFKEEYDKLIISAPIEDFIKDGTLSDIIYLPTDIVIENCNSIRMGVDGDFNNEALFKHMNNPLVYTSIVDAYIKYANNKKGIVYTINQKHNKKLQKSFEDNGISSVAIDSGTPLDIRKDLIEQFKRGDIQVLCNVDIFGEGFDCPDVDFIQLARPTKSLSLYLQQVGRGLRRTENKNKVLIIDNVGLYTRFGLPTKERDWQKHFEGEGKEIDYTPTKKESINISQIRKEYGLSLEIREVKHKEDPIRLSEVFSFTDCTSSYENDFRHYGEYTSRRHKSTVQKWISSIKKIDKFIQNNINSDFTSIFYCNNDELIQKWDCELSKTISFLQYDNKHDNRLLNPSLYEYWNFITNLKRRASQQQIKKAQEIPTTKHQELQNIKDRILVAKSGEITKEDLEITIATLCKLRLPNEKLETIEQVLLVRHKIESTKEKR